MVATLLAGCDGQTPEPTQEAEENEPLVLGVIGHSFLVGFNRDADHLGNSPSASWPSGDEDTSLRALLGASVAENVARGGASVLDIGEQAAQLEAATLVVVSFGANDACADPPMPANEFEAMLRKGVGALVGRGMQVLLLSEVDLVALFEASQPPTTPAPDASPPGPSLYAIYRACTVKPGTGALIAAYNDAITRVAQEEGVLHDGGAQYAVEWSSDLLSEVDGFHPNVAGGGILARTSLDAYRAASLETVG